MVTTPIDRERQIQELKQDILAAITDLREEAIYVLELAYELKMNLAKLFIWESGAFGE